MACAYDYYCNQHYEQIEQYEKTTNAMEALGLDPESSTDYEKYINELEDDEPNY